jgi:apolipoprotein N-acyltransferase
MKIPKNLSLRQTLEGMTLTFNPEAIPDLDAIIQFDVSPSTDAQDAADNEAGVYHLVIANGECTFHEGAALSPMLTIITPSDVWLKISRGDLTGYEALMQELYTATGELELLMKMDSLFKSANEVSYEAPKDQRPAGPIPLPGMAWMTVAFIPWIIHWSTFDIPAVSHWVSVGLPILLAVLIVGYRLLFSNPNANLPHPQSPTLMEAGSLAYFTLAVILALTGSAGYAHWGSIIASLVMGGLWLGSIQFAEKPLSAEYSKWGFIKPLWRNSMFLYPNAVISLMWGWQFIAASLIGVVAILLPEQRLVFTLVRYLLLVPAFIFTSTCQKRAPISNPRFSDAQLRFWAGMGLSAISGLLLTASMPGFDVPFIGWVSLVPLILVVSTAPPKEFYVLALPFGLLLSIGVHNWYPNIFPPTLGYFLIFAVGTFYAAMIHLGAWLQSRLNGWLKLLALPVAWSAIEFVKFIAPVVEDWWFVLLAKSAWRFPPALQVLGVGGFPALSFVVMLLNVAIAFLILAKTSEVFILSPKGETSEVYPQRASLITLSLITLLLVANSFFIPKAPSNTFTVAALTDLVNQDPEIMAAGEFDGTKANSLETSQAIFNLDAELTRSVADQQPDFVVWSENEFADADDDYFIDQLGELASEMGSYIVADVVWHADTGMHDTALMVSPSGEEVGRRAKINITNGEEDAGFSPGPRAYPVFSSPYGNVGLGVCWDRHRTFIVRELARNDADIVLMTVDDDFDASTTFPPFHASDGVFRAAENRVAMGLGTTSGISMVIDPYGRIVAEGEINKRGVIVGETFTAEGQTLYTRFGDWFGWLMVAALVALIIRAKS